MTPFADLLQQGAAAAWLFVPSAVLLGALHGLEPGHSKTMMAAFIVAIRGTFLQAPLLALTYGSHWSAETTELYFQLASAAIIIGIALWMSARTYRDRRAASAAAAHARDRAHDRTKAIDTGHGLVELSVFEAGVAPRFRVWFEDRLGSVGWAGSR